MEQLENNNEVQVRPQFLTVLCILTFISAGFGSIGSITTPLFSDMLVAFLQSNPNVDEEAMEMAMKTIEAGWGYYIFLFVLSLGSLTGAILMWKLKKIGFHVYSLSNLAQLFVPTLVLGVSISWGGIFLTVAFISLYALNFKHLK